MYLFILLASFLASVISEKAPTCRFSEIYRVPVGKPEFSIHPTLPEDSKHWEFIYYIFAGIQNDYEPYMILEMNSFPPGSDLVIDSSKLPVGDYIIRLFATDTRGKKGDCLGLLAVEDKIPVISNKIIRWATDEYALVHYLHLSFSPINLSRYYCEQIIGPPSEVMSLGSSEFALIPPYSDVYSFRVIGSNSVGNSTPIIVTIVVGRVPTRGTELDTKVDYGFKYTVQ